ncbi:VCBS repeat-containing protein [Pseudoalteromonas sp. NEC-BIFX-2020_015]|uniref:FG-GAP repeat domain-containing protein n=1 Tax=Pseudoalteromonas sp. NEC-BIFX-2020_015 TaxID=2729544 RepID=UPI0014614CBE|nr:VCBS repeat-containing protein [Pseudoalteromonas sp. NEC-BIFX-2020_015]NMR26908.1 VCBS repeat-containing protein [Pseudoalteromonas sp. NEC-BIFX-2020_015]
MLKTTAALTLLAFSPLLLASQQLVIKTTEQLITTDSSVLFAYNSEQNQLAKIDIENTENYALTVPDNALGFDVAKLANTPHPQALILTADGVYISQKEHSTLLFKYTSVLNRLTSDKLNKVSFVVDVNLDGLSDILLPDIETSTVYIQDQLGKFTPHTFKKESLFNGQFNDNHLTLDIDISTAPTTIDINRDGYVDLVFKNAQSARVLFATEQGFASKVTPLTLPVSIGKMDDDSKVTINHFADINHDSYLDFIIAKMPKTKGMDALDATVTRSLYLGQADGSFSNPISLPNTSAMGELIFEHDLDNDGLIDLQRLDVDFGFGTIASMAMGGGDTDVDIEFSFFKQLNTGNFSEKPNADFEVEAPLSMSNSGPVEPLKLADINGDGYIDAVYRYNKKTLGIYYGEQNNLFASKRKKIKHALPTHPRDILLVDLNNDSKHDFVFKFTEEDGTSKITTLISK